MEEVTIKGWVAREKLGFLFLYRSCPSRDFFLDRVGFWKGIGIPLDNSLFPQITWESEPQEVELTIKTKDQ